MHERQFTLALINLQSRSVEPLLSNEMRLKLDQFTVTGDIGHPLPTKLHRWGWGLGGKAGSAEMLNLAWDIK